VLFVDHTAKLGGAELSLLTVATAFRASSRVVLFESSGPFHDRLQQAGVDTTILPAPKALSSVRRDGGLSTALKTIPGVCSLAWRLSRIARSYDVVLANSQKSMLVAALAGVLARRPVVWYLRDLLTPAHFGSLQLRVAVAVANTCVSRVIANSHATKQALVEIGGDPDRIAVVHNGLDERPFQAVSSADVAEVRAELDLPASGVVGVFSRLAAWKGQHVLLEAVRALPEVTVLLVGDALFPEDEQYAEQLRHRIHEWGLGERVRMTGFRDDIPVLMRACDAVLHTSTAPEPFGRVLVEGMMAGRPVIATEEGGPAEIITNGRTGLLIPSENVKALQEAIQFILGNSDIAECMARKGHEHAQSVFSATRMIANARSVLEAVVT
jgi:glycosyltransferase involved in cell wall biosynthesis